MPTYRSIRCGKCKKYLEYMGTPYDVIGQPFIICPTCKTVNILSDKNEWELKSGISKAWFFFMMTLMGVDYGFGGGLLVAYLIAYFAFDQDKPEVQTVSIFAGVGILSMFWYLIRDFKKDIGESRARMADPAYRAMVLELTRRQ